MLTVVREADNGATVFLKGSVKGPVDPELCALAEALHDLDFAVSVIGTPPADLDRCEFCPTEDQTGTQPLAAVASIVTRPPASARVYREATCAGCAPTVLNRDHRRGLTSLSVVVDPDRERVWLEIPGSS